ncbi:MAG: AsmA family protein [Alphaproteobacteria bacterium]|nr:AsmA family protein [Alphaproteobacteria bacterium]
MKKFLLILLVIFLLVAGGMVALFYRSFDEKNFKEQIIASTKELTGCDVVIAGGINVKILPSPTVTLKDVIVKNNPESQSAGDLMKIETVEARIRFSSLLKNPLIVDNIVLNKPEIFLSRNEKGITNWNFSFLRNSHAVSNDNLLGESFVDTPPQFQNMELKNGVISYQNAISGTNYKLTELEGKITSSSITGPFDFSGTAKKDAIPLTISLFVDKLDAAPQTAFKMSIESSSSKAILSIRDGKIEKLGAPGQTFSGSLTFNIPKLSNFLLEKKGYKNLPEPLNKPVTGSGKFNITDKVFALNEVAVHYGADEIGDGSENAAVVDISYIYPAKPDEKKKITTQIQSALINLDTFVPYLPKQISWKESLVKAKEFLPKDLDIVMRTNKIMLFEQPIKDFDFSATLQDDTLTVREIKVNLPEEVLLKTSGIVDFKEEPVVKLDYSLQAKSIQKTLDWLKLKEFPVQTSKIDTLTVAGQFQLRSQDLTLGNIDMTINNGTVKGGIVFALTEPNLTGYVNLNLKKVNIDDFVPYEAPAKERTFKEWLQGVKAGLEKSPLLEDVNVSLTLSGQDITFQSLPMDQFTYEGKIENKAWKTNSLKVSQIAMSNIDYKGTIQKLPDNSLQFNDVQISLEMPKSMLLLSRLKIETPITNNSNKINLKTNFSGSFDEMNVASDISLTQGRIYLQGTVKKVLAEASDYSLLVKLSHPNFHQFMRLFGVELKQLPSLNGNFSFEGNVRSVPQKLSFTNTDMSIGSQKIQGNLELSGSDSGIAAKGSVKTPYLYFDKFFTANDVVGRTNTTTGKSNFSNSLFKFDAIKDLSLDIQLSAEKASLGKMELEALGSHILLSEKMLVLDKTTATLNGGKLDFSSALNYSTAIPFIKGSLKLNEVPLRADLITLGMFRLKSGVTSLALDFNARGNSLNDMIHELSSTGNFTINNGAISSLNLKAFEHRVRTTLARSESLDNLAQQLNREMTVGETEFDSLAGSFAVTNGILRTSDTVLRTPDANAIIQTSLDISELMVNSSWAINFKSFTGYPPISILIKGMMYNPQTNIDFASFINYMKTTSNDIKERLVKQEQAKQQEQLRKESRERTQSLFKMVENARDQIAKTEQIMALASTPETKTELIRVKDAFVILQELANKQSPSVADTEKAAQQASLIESRTSMILKSVTEQAVQAIRQEIKATEQKAQEKMHSINKINQRLYSVEFVEEAYKNAFEAMTLIKQILSESNKSSDLEKLNEYLQNAQEALSVIEGQYESIAKFDLDSQIQEEPAPSSKVSGSIRRAS